MAKNHSQTRLFFALELTPEIKTQLMGTQDKLARLQASRVRADNLHLTLSFLGQTPQLQLQTILDNFEPLKLAPFEITLNEIIYWTKANLLAVSTVSQPSDSLIKCKQQIEKQLRQLKIFNFDKKTFKPHITLFRNLEQPPESCINFFLEAEKLQQKALTLSVDSISLMQTVSTAQGHFYETVDQWSLQDNRSVKAQLLGR